LTAILILVLSALFAAPLFIDWNDYRPAFETQATKLLGRQVKVGGEVHLVLLPAPELRFDDVKVADQEGRLDRPLLEARSLEAVLNISALLSGTVEARKIAIVDPILRLDLKADGTGNWSDVGRRGVALPFAPKDVMLDEVGVSGGRIEVAKQGVPQFTLDNIAGQASAQSLSGPYKVSANYDFEGRPQELKFSTSAPDAAGLFRIKSALRDLDRNTTYAIDGGASGLGAKPEFDGTMILRAATVASANEAEEGTPADTAEQPSEAAPRDRTALYELKGPVKATPDRAELPDFDLTLHANGHPQIFKGKLVLEFGDRVTADAELAASFVDVDALLAVPGTEQRPTPAEVLYLLADKFLGQATEFSDGKLAVTVDQAGLGGDLIGAVDLALAAKGGALTVERLKAVLPGDNRIEASGQLAQGKFGPIFTGPVQVAGSKLKPLTRWAVGDRDVSGQASAGDFSLMANATIGDGELTLADVSGELSGTKFHGGLRLHGGERRLIELNLDSDRLDVRDMIGDGPLWQSWLPSSGTDNATEAGQSLLGQFRDDDMRVTLRIGELVLPNIAPGRLDARFGFQRDTLQVDQLDFAAPGALSLSGKGRIERVSESPAGRVDFALSAATGDSLRIAADLFGFPPSVTKSSHLSALAPVNVHVSLVAAREGELTNAAIELGGSAGGSDVSLVARALGDPDKPGEAKIAVDGSATGERPQAFIVLLFPDLPVERLAAAGQTKGKLTVKLVGVPNTKLTGKAALESGSMGVAFDGQGSLQPAGFAFAGKGAMVSQDASQALTLIGFESPPSAAAIPLQLRFGLTKQGPSVDVGGITGMIAGDDVSGSAHFDLGGTRTRFALSGSADTVSLPSLLGVLVAWHRTPSTDEMLGAINNGASEVWPARGFALGPIERSEGSITLKANTLTLGPTLKVQNAAVLAAVGQKGLSITSLTGRLFGGEFTASGTLAPRGNGAELTAQADIKGGKLEDFAKSVTGSSLAKGPFDLGFMVQGEGLSPPGLVAGLSGQGSFSLGAGALQALSPDPLRRVAATAAKKTIKADKDEIAAQAQSVRDKITKGTYKYAPVQVTFDIKNGTLRLTPATLTGAGAETKINGYIELASLKLDSEWALKLAGADSGDVPPVGLVFTGALNKADEISPAVDTAAIEAYLTMRRMQEGVEQLETLDVSGTSRPDIEAAPEDQTAAVPTEPMAPATESAVPDETAQPEPASPATEAEASPVPPHRPSPSAAAMPSATELLQEGEPSTALPDAAEIPPPAPVVPLPSEAAVEPSAAPEPAPPAAAAPASVPKPAPPPTIAAPAPAAKPAPVAPVAAPAPAPKSAPSVVAEPTPAAKPAPAAAVAEPAPPLPAEKPPAAAQTEAAATPDAEPAPAVEEVAPVRPKPARRRAKRPVEAPDAWKKGIPIFGGG
jgi:hypothetical protein